jgi:hypothetical protein
MQFNCKLFTSRSWWCVPSINIWRWRNLILNRFSVNGFFFLIFLSGLLLLLMLPLRLLETEPRLSCPLLFSSLSRSLSLSVSDSPLLSLPSETDFRLFSLPWPALLLVVFSPQSFKETLNDIMGQGAL